MIRQIGWVVVCSVVLGFSLPTPSQATSARRTENASAFDVHTSKRVNMIRVTKTASCADGAGSTVSKLLRCLEVGTTATPSFPVRLVFHIDPKVTPSAKKSIKRTARWALKYYRGFFVGLKRSATIHIIVPLSSKWCGTQVVKFDWGSSSPTTTAKSYLCKIDGGGNAGHADSPSTAFVSARPYPDLVRQLKDGSWVPKEGFASLIAAEMGHASRSLMMEAYTGEMGGQPYWPIWAQYLANDLMWLRTDLKVGVSEKEARDQRIWWNCDRNVTWRPDYGDSRLTSWESGSGGIYGCPGGPGDQTNVDVPNQYNMAYVAAEYLTLTRGFDWVLQVFMPRPLKDRRGDGSRNLDKSAAALGWADWTALEAELNAYLWETLESYGSSIPKQ